MNAMRKLGSPTLALLLMAALPSFAPAMNGETDQGVLQAVFVWKNGKGAANDQKN